MEKFKNFLKRESFYVILSVCLVILATVAVMTGGKKAEQNAANQGAIANDTVKENEVEEETGNTNIVDDAELVKKEEEKAKDTAKKEETVKQDDESVATSSKPKSELISPIKEGTVTRQFNIAPRVEKDGKAANVYKGIDIEAVNGAEVFAIADGEVIEAQSGDSREGNYVKVKHSNDLTVMYGNLDVKLKVKKGDKITQGTVLGNVGNSIKVSPTDRVSENYLLLHVEKDNEPIDPLNILKDMPIKK